MNPRKQDAPANAAEWLAELGNQELTTAQRAAFADWLRESPAHVREVLQVTLIQEDLRKLNISSEQVTSWVDAAKSAAQEPTRISSQATFPTESEASCAAKTNRPTSFSGGRLRGWLSAACLAAALLLGGLIFRWAQDRYTTAFGEQRIVTLTDGSVVEINTDSALQVRFSGHQRAIHMIKGEAFFRVAHDASRPFVVSAGEVDVQAVGTQFNVRMGNDSTLVSVVDGTVEVRDDTPDAGAAPSEKPPVRVTTGEEARITPVQSRNAKNRLEIAKIAESSPQRSASWTRGRVEFENTPLGDVLSEFQRYRNVRVIIDDESIRQLRLTGSFDAHDPDAALAFIATLPGMNVSAIDAHTFRIQRDDRQQTPRP